ncbi:MAG: hypothetical protein JSR48_00755 [Verrucomicrobia bacterium]|nr:hypothetical protein [Verrucomicrobiota bacterium]
MTTKQKIVKAKPGEIVEIQIAGHPAVRVMLGEIKGWNCQVLLIENVGGGDEWTSVEGPEAARAIHRALASAACTEPQP